ncbi:transmembrane cell adhesion receptor mua-3-like, partial [Ruditapes philippinarum]|uniref:transmembrane cell adhesion receptor mua-3-like n=1 Tax=Ruditapes philippinarum TaxID=129788 RepID=UPI00295AF714
HDKRGLQDYWDDSHSVISVSSNKSLNLDDNKHVPDRFTKNSKHTATVLAEMFGEDVVTTTDSNSSDRKKTFTFFSNYGFLLEEATFGNSDRSMYQNNRSFNKPYSFTIPKAQDHHSNIKPSGNYTLITIFIGIVSLHCLTAAKVTETSCTKGTANQCEHTQNAECDDAETDSKCKCSDGFAEDRTDGSTCVKTVSGTTCDANGNECNSISNSQCDTNSCKCNDGFVMNVDVCDADTSGKVTETGCTKYATDQCKHTPNAECDNVETGAKCKCSDGYAEDITDGKTCVKIKVTETGCTKDASDQCKHTPNAECDNANTDSKCKCSDGFIEDKTDGSTCVKG